MNKILSVIFTLIYFSIGLFFFAASVHAPNFFPYSVLVFLALSIAVLWWAYYLIRNSKLKYKTLGLLLSGLVIAGLMVGACFLSLNVLSEIEIYEDKKQAANTKVLNMQEELLYSQAGNPIGVRLKYSMIFPKNDYFWQLPTMDPQQYLNINILANMRNTTQVIEPSMIAKVKEAPKFEKDKNYNFVMDMVPNFIGQDFKTKKICIIAPQAAYVARFNEIMADEKLKIKYVISISGTEYTAPTKNLYSLKTFYDSAIKEGAVQCATP